VRGHHMTGPLDRRVVAACAFQVAVELYQRSRKADAPSQDRNTVSRPDHDSDAEWP
jgi:hypothetical protein